MPASTTLPKQSLPTYCTDEDILVRAGGDMFILTPSWQQMAAGNDGVFEPGFPWVLTSASVDFGANGVQPNMVVQLTTPKANFPGGGQALAIDSVLGNSITLRRAHMDLEVGQAPAPSAGLTGVAFTINTLFPQIEEASFDLKRRFAVDDTVSGDYSRTSAYMYDQRDLRIANVLMVLFDRYTQENRGDHGDFDKKVKRIESFMKEIIGRIQIRWGAFGSSAPPTSIWGCHLSR